MSNRGRGWKSGKWGSKWGKRQGGGVASSWRTNYRGWMSKGGNSGWGSSLGRMGSRLGGGDWGGGGRIRSSLSGSMDPGVGLSSLGQGDTQRQSGTGGILSNFEPSWGSKGGAKPRFIAISGDLEGDVRERYEQRVTALIYRYAQIFYNDDIDDDLSPVVDNLREALGPKYASLALDWAHEKREVPAIDSIAKFVIWIVEAAAVDGGREPLLWRIQRAISVVLDHWFGGRDEQEVQDAGQMGTIATQA